MAIHWSLERLEALLPAEIYARLDQISCNPAVPINSGGNYPIIHAETGDILAGVPYKRGLRVPRSKMRKLCGEGIDVQYGKRLDHVKFGVQGKGVTAFFDDGTEISGTILIGADGTRSHARTIAIGSAERAAPTPFSIWHMNLTVCYGDANRARFVRSEFPTSFLALSQRSFHAFQSISSMPDGPEHPETWIFHLAMAWNGEARHELSHAERLALIKEKAKHLAEPVRSSFTWIPGDTQVHKADISYWVTQQWNNRDGRLTLIGDAAHPMPPCM
jgi:2-polyprenyl-6-methoxyphenol hydroxylase-like FAD-dependent oxidoreductase